jgi:hypothetical protein
MQRTRNDEDEGRNGSVCYIHRLCLYSRFTLCTLCRGQACVEGALPFLLLLDLELQAVCAFAQQVVRAEEHARADLPREHVGAPPCGGPLLPGGHTLMMGFFALFFCALGTKMCLHSQGPVCLIDALYDCVLPAVATTQHCHVAHSAQFTRPQTRQ